MSRFCVYKVTDITNNKIYIGKATLNARWEKYLGSGVLIKQAIREKGRENFKKEILQIYDEEADAYAGEQRYIAEYNSRNRNIGYNIAKGSDGAGENRYTHNGNYRKAMQSDSYKEKQRQHSLDMWANMTDEEYMLRCERSRAAWTGEKRAARSKMLAERFQDPEYLAAYRKKLSDGVKKSLDEPGHIDRLKAAINKPEAKAKLKDSLKKRYEDPFYKELNAKVRQPLSVLSKKLRKGQLTDEEYAIARKNLLEIEYELFINNGKDIPKRLKDEFN